MTDRTFKDLAKMLKTAYKRDNFLGDKDTMDLWFRLLSDLQDADVELSAVNWVKESQYPPTIADIRKGVERFDEDRREKRNLVRQEFASIVYPNKDKEDEAVFYSLVYSLPEEKWIDGARFLYNAARDAVEKAEVSVEKLENVLRKAAKR